MVHPVSKILIVDDYAHNRIALEKLLEPIDYTETLHASSGNEALALLLHHSFSVILLDVNMPEMDGYEVAELISSTDAFKHTPIVMLTAHDTTPKNILKAYESGAVDYLSKPIEPAILINKVKQFVTLDQLQAQTNSLRDEREMILEAAGQGVIKVCEQGKIQFANAKSGQLFNCNQKDILGTQFNNWFTLSENKNNANLFDYILEHLKNRNSYQQQEIILQPKNKAEHQVELTCTPTLNNQNTSMVVLFQDVTQRLELENKLTHLANYDPLTQLANRAYFHDNVLRALSRSKRLNSSIYLLMLDLDHFKQINDTLGHDIGDELLQQVAIRLKSLLRESDLAARLGGDEFAILLEDSNDIAAEQVASKIIQLIAQPFIIQDKEIFAETSIGISNCQNGNADKSSLLKWADIALYEAKAAGRNRYQCFVQAMSEQREQHAYIQKQLRHVIEDNALLVNYQPQYSMSKDQVIGFEALVRWPKTGYGDNQISPAIFIPIAEQSFLIHEIGENVLKQSCDLLALWHTQPSKKHLSISVNLSAKQLNAPKFLERIKSILSHYDFPLKNLVFEITETAILTYTNNVTRTINTITEMGIGLALDDFGTGYSSLNYLQNLPFNVIKIDQCFIHRLGECKKTAALVKAIMTIADACEMDVVAEGVENEIHLEHVINLGCNKVQGYYYSKPLCASKIDDLLSKSTHELLAS